MTPVRAEIDRYCEFTATKRNGVSKLSKMGEGEKGKKTGSNARGVQVGDFETQG